MAEKSDSQSLPEKGKLTMDHFKLVIHRGWDLRNKWKDIGIELGIDPASLDVIKQNNNGNPDDCFKDVMQLWLRNANTDPTLEQLDKALTAKTVIGEVTKKLEDDVKGEATTVTDSTGEPDITTVGVKKQKSPIHLLEGSKLKLVNRKEVKQIVWKQDGESRKEPYIECSYTNESNKGIPVFIQKGYDIPQLLEVNSNLQYGWQGDFYFFILHDKDRRPFQHRFVSTKTKEFFKQASSTIAGIWGAHLETVNDE